MVKGPRIPLTIKQVPQHMDVDHRVAHTGGNVRRRLVWVSSVNDLFTGLGQLMRGECLHHKRLPLASIISSTIRCTVETGGFQQPLSCDSGSV